jgi:GNAT superfamily N-acetyltransferase
VYFIRQVDGDEYADELGAIELAVGLPRCPYENCWWWLACMDGTDGAPVGYLGMLTGISDATLAYVARVGVLPEHRGHRLQLRLMRAAERFARRQGFLEIISDTTNNPASANNFIRAGFFTYAPAKPWAFQTSIYWRKEIQ